MKKLHKTKQGIHTQLLGKELTDSIPEGYEVFYDHGDLNGRIIAYYDEYSRATQLSFVDIAVIDKKQREAIILCEVEERIPAPKKILGDIITLILAEKIRYKNLDYVIYSPYLVFGFKVKEKGKKVSQVFNLINRLEDALNTSLKSRVRIITSEELDLLREFLKKEFFEIINNRENYIS
jgi:hypothetical protein